MTDLLDKANEAVRDAIKDNPEASVDFIAALAYLEGYTEGHKEAIKTAKAIVAEVLS